MLQPCSAVPVESQKEELPERCASDRRESAVASTSDTQSHSSNPTPRQSEARCCSRAVARQSLEASGTLSAATQMSIRVATLPRYFHCPLKRYRLRSTAARSPHSDRLARRS